MVLNPEQYMQLYHRVVGLMSEGDFYGARDHVSALIDNCNAEIVDYKSKLEERLNLELGDSEEDGLINEAWSSLIDLTTIQVRSLNKHLSRIIGIIDSPSIIPKKPEGRTN